MGSFQGHIFPGSIFIIVGVWWLIQILRRYYICRNTNTTFVSSASFKIKRFPADPVFKIFFVTAGLIIEIGVAGNMQHATMYFFYGLTGVIDLMIFCNFHLPKDLDYVSLCLAVVMEAILFKFHLFGRNILDVLVHNLLLYVLAATFFALLLEMKFKTSVLAALLRPFFFILQGTWFCQVGFILYNPILEPWQPGDHQTLMRAALAFTWHCAGVFIILLFTFSSFSRIYRKDDVTGESCSYIELLEKDVSETEI